jgi:hypothetical protein
MKELTRFVQIRATQSLAPEQIDLLTLPLYRNSQLSSLAKVIAMTGEAVKKDLVKTVPLIDEHTDIYPLILATYNWLDYKAKPTLAEFTLFAKEELNGFAGNFNKDKFILEWESIADSILILVIRRKLQDVKWIDFQLLIKACYVIDTFLKDDGCDFIVEGKEGAFLELLNKPLVIPSIKLIKSTVKNKLDFPKLNSVKELNVGDFHTAYNDNDQGWVTPIDPKDPKDPKDPPSNDIKDCSCECDDECKKSSTHCMNIEPYVGDLLIVKEELIRYKESDIAYIENVLAGELKQRKHRSLHRTEDFSETEQTDTSSEERDNQVTEIDSLQSEVSKTVQADANVQAGIVSTAAYGTAISTTVNASAGASISKATSDTSARNYSREIVDRSVTNVETKKRTVNSSETINELEEKNKHVINNDSEKHRAGIYYWVDKVTKAQVFNYGKRMMFDLVIPEPAALYKKLIQIKREGELEGSLIPPVRPDINWNEISRDKYQELLEEYGVTGAPVPPDRYLSIDMSVEKSLDEGAAGKTVGFSLNSKSDPIPDDYSGVSFDYDIDLYVGTLKADSGAKDEAAVTVTAENYTLLNETVNNYEEDNAGKKEIKHWNANGSRVLESLQGPLNVTVSGFSSISLGLSCGIRINCEFKKEAFEGWQLGIYDLIMTQYNSELAQFKSEEAAAKSLLEIKGQSSFVNRETEKNELKRHIISILMCNYFNGVGSMMEKVEDCGYPEIDFEKLEAESPMIQFFEQVFEWNYITYLFYHSMWARKCKWPDLIEADSGDTLFDQFLMAGAAKIQLPVRPGLEPLFSWFLESGRPWTGATMPPYFSHNRYISLLEEIKASKNGDYSDRIGSLEVVNGSKEIIVTNSDFYWDHSSNTVNDYFIENDIDRELLIDLKIYRIVGIIQTDPADETTWTITISEEYPKDSATNLVHAVGAKFVGAPWEVIVPTELTYLRNEEDVLPTYPLD